MLFVLDGIWVQAEVRLHLLESSRYGYTLFNVPDAIRHSHLPALLHGTNEQLKSIRPVILYLLFILDFVAACAEPVVSFRKLRGHILRFSAINLPSVWRYYAANLHPLYDFDDRVGMDSNDRFLAHSAG